MILLDSTSDLSGSVTFDLTINPTDYNNDLLNLVLNLRPAWSREKITFKEFNGGLTNKLIGCVYDGVLESKDTILCRIYGSGTEKYIDREDEVNNMRTLSSIKLGPKVHCKFNNGICYEYLPGVIVNTQFLMNVEMYEKVAKLVAKMHLVKQSSSLGSEGDGGEGILFNKLHELLKLVPDDYTSIVGAKEEEISRIPTKALLETELCFMEEYLKRLVATNRLKLVFSHNDLLLANIIYNKELDEIYFIDYEYSGLNWQAYDIANHFNEYAGIEPVDYGLYPSREYQHAWLRCYLSTMLSTDQVSEDAIEALYKEVSKFSLVSHLFWGIWSIVQARYSNNDFNFANYAHIRLSEYFKRKQECINF